MQALCTMPCMHLQPCHREVTLALIVGAGRCFVQTTRMSLAYASESRFHKGEVFAGS